MEIIFDKLCFKYDDNLVFDDLNVQIKSGLVTGVIGKNGSGKSTLLDLIDTLVLPKKGKIIIDGVQINSKSKKQSLKDIKSKISYFYNDNNEIIKIGNSNSFVNESLQRFGIEKIEDISSLSKGEVNKVSLIEHLLRDADLILLDNPTLYLDSKSKSSLIKFIRSLKVRYGKTIIIASSDMDFIHSVCDDVLVLCDKPIIGNKYNIFKDDVLMKSLKLKQPDLITIPSTIYKKKQINIGYRDDIKDLIKDIYRYAK